MGTSERFDDATIAMVARSALAQNPTATVAAIGVNGRFCPLPPDIPAGAQAMIATGTFLEMVADSHKAVLVSAWGNCRSHGLAHVRARFLANPDVLTEINLFDLRRQSGVLLAVLRPAAGDGADIDAGDRALLRPRVCRIDKDEIATITAIDDATVRMLGWSAEQIVSKPGIDIIVEEDRERAVDAWVEMIASSNSNTRWRGRYKRADGSTMWVETTNFNRLDEDPPLVASELRDITDEMEAHEALRQNEELLRRLTDALPVGVAQFDEDGALVYRNTRLGHILGSPIASTGDLVAVVHPDDAVAVLAAIESASSTEGSDLDVRIPRNTDDEITCALTFRPSGSGGSLVCVNDITDRTRLRHELEMRATLDELTGAHNRAATMLHLDDALRRDRSRGRCTGLVFVDLDGLKAVNDTYGHTAGDALLREAASRLRYGCRGDDLVGRFGGDEFLLVTPGMHEPSDLTGIVARVAFMITGDVQVAPDVWLPLRASVGGAADAEGLTTDGLVAAADAAMYADKHRKRSDAAHDPLSTTLRAY